MGSKYYWNRIWFPLDIWFHKLIRTYLSIEQFPFMAVDDQKLIFTDKLVFDPCQTSVVQSNTFSPNQNHFGIIEGQTISFLSKRCFDMIFKEIIVLR